MGRQQTPACELTLNKVAGLEEHVLLNELLLRARSIPAKTTKDEVMCSPLAKSHKPC